MSSRAIRKLQKLREQESQQSPAPPEQGEDEVEDSDNEESIDQPSKPKLNAFDILGGGEEEENDDAEDTATTAAAQETPIQPSKPAPTPANVTDSNKKKKNNKKKKKAKASSKTPKSEESDNVKSNDAELDEIDRALKELSTGEETSHDTRGSFATGLDTTHTSFAKTPEELLCIEPKFLSATNEMRKLFGNVVLETFEGEEGTGRRRERRGGEMVDLGTALTGRYSPASRGQSFAGITLRRNALMQGKDEWPRAPSGGLGMVMEEKLSTGNTVYRIVHNTSYKDVQRQFDMCVESMDPQRLIYLLQYNPYHISTLLQVSEIAKHQGDHAVSADLLERALFNIGRSTQSTFGKQLREGRANLNFIHAENRELWLVGWRYIANLGMKGTWRTAYEWAKLLLSLDTEDPYCIKLIIDHLALRGREYAHFAELCTQTKFSQEWAPFPNIQCSLVLAYVRLNKPQESRQQLHLAMSRYPWIFRRIAEELNIDPVPPRIWGKFPPTESDELFSELYIARAKDLWNTPEIVMLIDEVANTLGEEDVSVKAPKITQNIARHVIVSDIPRVTSHLPTQFTSGMISASDPLPPYESEAFRQQSDPVPAYLSRLPAGRPQWIRDLLAQIVPVHPSPDQDDDEDSGEEESVEQWLLGDGLRMLEGFLRQNGVDRGNWEDANITPLYDYVDALLSINSEEERQALLHGPIRNAVGDIVVTILEDEIETLIEDASNF